MVIIQKSDDEYSLGHYFSNELKAKCDLLKRADNTLNNEKYDFIDNIESSISNGQAVEPQDYDFYKTLVSEPEQINSEVDMNEDFEMQEIRKEKHLKWQKK